MTKETMNIHKALCELKILDDRINRAVDDCRYVGVTKIVSKRVGSQTVEAFSESVKDGFKSAFDLIKRRQAIKSAVVKSNATTTVVIGGTTYTIAEAIEMKNHGMDGEKRMLRFMVSRLAEAESLINRTRSDLESRADAFIRDQTGGKESKTEDTLKMRQDYIAMQDVELVDPLHIRDIIKELDEKINTFMTEVDSALQTSNANTEITIEY
ncbi:MAG: hypothetical protein PUF41_11795 [Prevotella copri]|nr:hypothetical protein [Segatella copri]